jgi:glucose-6-phosphate 1-dehydrogenase
LFVGICANLHGAGLIDERARVVLEKPLGHDLASARQINDDVGRYFQEQQIFRIDHYLGKETVQNLMVLRFGNTIFEPLWRSPYIKSVQITVAESVGVGSRAGFYDGTGAMRDMVQNHLLQLLCIVAMEPPVSLDPDAVRDEKLKVLRSLRPMTMADVARDTVRGQYSAGASNGDAAAGYLQEANIPEGSTTETFVALKAHINNWRWANVPIFLRTGKRMAARQSEIVIEFADLPFTIFGDSAHKSVNRLMIRLQPEEHIQLQMMAKEPGSGMKLRPVNLNLDLETAFSERRAEAYERLLIDVTKGRLTHFMRRDELEAAWSWVEPIINGWQQLNEKPKAYTAGSWGPAASSALMAREGSSWVEES